MPETPLLSKTLFQAGRECPKRMWLDHHREDLKPRMSLAEEARMREGIAVGKLAQRLYPGGVTAKYVGATDELAAEKTRELIESGAETIFEATFVAGDRVVRCDVLRKSPQGGWIVDEVKATTGPDAKKAMKDGHVHDVAYQLAALRKCGIEVTGGGLVVLDKTYAWDGGEHDLERLFARLDLTADCETLRKEVEREAVRLGTHLVSPAAPEAEINTHCKKCDYKAHCLEHTPKDDVMFLPYATRKGTDKLRGQGYRTIREIPLGVLTDKRMAPTHRVLTSGEPWVCAGLDAALDAIVLPAAFIDFESCQPAVPAYPGTNPYQQVCFQWSAHLVSLPLVRGRGGVEGGDLEVEHREYLHSDAFDPRPEFCRTLWDAVKNAKTLVIYSAFETTQVRKMAEAGIPFAAELLAKLENDTVDLEKIVANHVCLEEFRFRTSIKTVLPALVPTMSYKGMAIADGTAAMTEFRRMIDPTTDPVRAAQIRTDLLAYCKQDTLAMVEIYRALRRMA
jgi:hypothetical protein